MEAAQHKAELLVASSFVPSKLDSAAKARMLCDHAITQLREEQSAGAVQVSVISMSLAFDLQ